LACLDWSVRRPHLAGGLGAALLTKFETLGWAKRSQKSRIIEFNKLGEESLLTMLKFQHAN
ncbi:MAG: transcriptional regulator, partial [Rhizobiales bacterium]|nr:transcriptional regulator [Hyphomicrobiales bacterium]